MFTKNEEILSLRAVQDLIEHIKTIDCTDSFYAYTYIYNLLNNLIIPAPPVTIQKGKKFIRGRVHRNNEVFFEKITDVSYRRDNLNILNFGRANEPFQSIFYCSDNQETAISETFTVAREDRDIEYEEITWSVWELQKNIDLVYVIGNPDKTTPNKTVNTATEIFLRKIKNFENEDQVLFFHKFISDQFILKANGHNALYKISCAFANYMYKHDFQDSQTREIKQSCGVMYSSSICPDIGLNIALTPKIVDDALRCIGVQKARVERIANTNRYEEKETFLSKRIDISKNKIYW